MGKKKDNQRKSWIYTGISLFLVLLTWGLTLFAKTYPEKVEVIYASGIYPYLIKGVGKVVGILPLAIGEMLVFAVILAIILGVVLVLIKPGIVVGRIGKIFHLVIRVVALAYVCFYFIWGFNYYRQDYMTLANINQEPATMEDLEGLTREVISKANALRANLAEDDNGVFVLEKDFESLANMANEGFQGYFVGPRDLGGDYGRAKPLKISRFMSYTGITGIYFPYTGEPNVNIDIPDASLLGTMCHEMAHQRGFAREDEANFIAFKAATNSPYPEFQYAGYYLAIEHLLSDISRRDYDLYVRVSQAISDPVRRDLNDAYDYWKMREGKVEKAATTLNDNYLKANNQVAGVESYNGVVRLLLGEYKSN